MSNQPLVNVVTAFYNAADYLREWIVSVWCQAADALQTRIDAAALQRVA